MLLLINKNNILCKQILLAVTITKILVQAVCHRTILVHLNLTIFIKNMPTCTKTKNRFQQIAKSKCTINYKIKMKAVINEEINNNI